MQKLVCNLFHLRTIILFHLYILDFYNRRNEIDELNSKNRWIKRGIALTFMDYQVEFFGALNALVSIYHQDGTVAISHGGVEMGQGMNTKAAQVAAHVLDIPLEYISVKPTNNLINANASCTGGSQTSEAVCYVCNVNLNMESNYY